MLCFLPAVLLLSLEHLPAAGPHYALTFDAHEAAFGAAGLLHLLRERRLRVTLFVTGRFALAYPRLLQQAVAEGHELANHTFSHPHLTTYGQDGRHQTLPGMSRQRLQEELRRAEAALVAATGRLPTKLWRAPYGEINHSILRWACELGYLHVGWTGHGDSSLDAVDWVADPNSPRFLSPEAMARRLLRAFDRQPEGGAGSILLMHLGSTRPEHPLLQALPMLLDELDRRGLTPRPVGELLRGFRSGCEQSGESPLP